MNEAPDLDDPAFEASLRREMQAASSTVEPDVERAFRAVSDGSIGRSSRGPQRFLAVAAAIAVLGAGAVGVSRLGSTGDDVVIGPVGEATTTVTSTPEPLEDPAEGGPGTTEPGGEATTVPVSESRLVSAADIPVVSAPLTGGNAARVVTELSSPGSDEPFVFVEVFADIGEVLSASSVDGPFDRRFDDTLFIRRSVLDSGLPTVLIAEELRNAGGLAAASLTIDAANDRLWDDAWDLLASTTLTNQQRVLLFEVLENELGVSYTVFPLGIGSVETVEVRWNGHSENEPRALLIETKTGIPVRYAVGDLDGDEGFTAVIDYSVSRVSTTDLDIAPTPPTEEPGVAELAVALDGQGLLAINPETGDSTLVPFGSARSDVVELVVMSYSSPGSEIVNEECGGGPLLAVRWGGLILYFESNAPDPASALFLGWAVNGPSPVITTADGLGVGTTTDVLVGARAGEVFLDSSFGWEYFDGTTSWVASGLAGEQVIDAFWAGESCVFR